MENRGDLVWSEEDLVRRNILFSWIFDENSFRIRIQSEKNFLSPTGCHIRSRLLMMALPLRRALRLMIRRAGSFWGG